MAESVGAAASGHPNLSLTAEEKRVYGELFKEADPDGFGAVSGDVAVKFFEKTRLPPDVLGQIWQLADTENRGFLTPSGFGVVLRLIGHAQAGRIPSAELATQPAPLPRFESSTSSIAAQNTGPPASPAPTAPAGPPPIRVPPLAPEKVNEYSSLFEKSGAENGYLSGLVAKQIFERARLPNEVLGRIWNLSDSQGRGALDMTEFVVAMHLLASFKAGAMRGVPNTLPPGLFEAASRRQPLPRATGSRPGSGITPVSGIPPQFSGFGNPRPQSPIARQQVSTPLSTQSTGDGWAVTPADKARFDAIFASLDKVNRGFITGDQAVSFFGNARLPEEILASIWDLADINSAGQLSRDEFAVAMYLIRQQRGTKDGRGNLPSTLPPALVPPSMRKQQIAPSQPTAPAFENAAVTQSRSAADDLFGLDAFAASTPAPAQVAQSTGGSLGSPFANPKSAPAISPQNSFKPFVPSSSFGQSIVPQPTGSSSVAQTRSVPPQTVASDDLLGDADPDVSSKLTNETSELGNLSNQISTLSKQMTESQAQRGQAEQQLAQNSQQKRDFEARLSQLRSAYEQEVRDVKAIQEQLSASKAETKRLQQDVAIIDGSHQDLRTQHQQLFAALQADQKENAALKEKIRASNAEVEQLKLQLEKLRSDARQQKGLVAINKKQLATNEAERDRLTAEIATARQEAENAAREAEETSRQVEASNKEIEEAKAAPPPTVRSPPAVASPTPSTSSNPFFRRTGTSISETTFSPPAVEHETSADRSNAFDNIFGPSFGGAAATEAAPTTSFRSETPPQSRDMSAAESHMAETVQSSPPAISTPISHVVEPPEPPESRQITSAALPFRAPLSRSDSISSSVRVAPPASRLSPADTPRAPTPTAQPTIAHPAAGVTHETKKDEDASAGLSSSSEHTPTASVVDRSLTEEPSENAVTEKVAPIPGAFPDPVTPPTEVPPHSEVPYQGGHLPAIAFGAGGATLAAGAAIAAASAVSHDENHEESSAPAEGKGKGPAIDEPEESKAKQSNFDDFFGGPAHQRTPSEQAADFDSAFASINKQPTTNGTGQSGKEFPDIREVEGDDSDESSEAPLGFDDDFAAASPARKVVKSEAEPSQTKAEVASALPNYLSASRPALETAPSNASSLPDISSQVSPPTYGESVPANDPSHFPPEFKGLLPSREDPTSPTVGGSSGTELPSSSGPPSYGPEFTAPRTQVLPEPSAAPTALATQKQSSPFDFDSAFAGMAPAQHEDDSDDEDANLALPHTSQNHAHEFDPTFDSSPIRSQSNTATSRTFPGPPTASSSVYSTVTANGQQYIPNSVNTAANNFSTFGGDVLKTPSKELPSPPAAAGTDRGVSHDWDDIFAGLGSSGTTGAAQNSTAVEAIPSAAHETVTGASASNTFPPTTTSAPAKIERPALGRALSDGTEHDDPILKSLTAMGWNREESLKALEKYDYNIDKAADYLTFRS